MKLEITEKTAKEIYENSPSSLRTILEETFGVDCFKKTDFRDFKTFDDLCRATGTTENDFNKKWDPATFGPSTIAFERLKICTRAYNQDWAFNAYNTDQYKWYPYFQVSSSGFGFSCTTYGYDDALTLVGSRLCFESNEKATHAGETFNKLFEDFIIAKY
jgi:hypothetical protein